MTTTVAESVSWGSYVRQLWLQSSQIRNLSLWSIWTLLLCVLFGS